MTQYLAALALHHPLQHAASAAPGGSDIGHGLLGALIVLLVLWVLGRLVRAVFPPASYRRGR